MLSPRLAVLIVMSVSLTAFAQPVKTGGDPGHRQAAIELCEVMDMEATLAASINTMMDLQMSENQMIAQHRAALEAFFQEHMSWDALKEDFIELYTAFFTETELREMAAFYQTPTGQKAIKLMPQLMQRGAQIGIHRVKRNQAALQRLIIGAGK